MITTQAEGRVRSRSTMTHTITAETEADAIYEARQAHIWKGRVAMDRSIFVLRVEDIQDDGPVSVGRLGSSAEVVEHMANLKQSDGAKSEAAKIWSRFESEHRAEMEAASDERR